MPLFFSFDGDAVYFQCHPGEKDDYLDSTEEACLTVVHMATDDVWESALVFGPVERLTLTDELEAARAALMAVPFPPLHGYLPHGTPKRSDRQVYYLRLQPTRMTGMASTFKLTEAPSFSSPGITP